MLILTELIQVVFAVTNFLIELYALLVGRWKLWFCIRVSLGQNVFSMLILASSSSYRKAQLAQLGLQFRSIAPQVDEAKIQTQISEPARLAQTLAELKAEAVQALYPDATILAGDQLVSLDDQIFGKPGTKKAAVTQLLSLSGRTHTLITAVCILRQKERMYHVDKTQLTVRALSADAVNRYVERDNPIDCAGSYKFEQGGIVLFERVQSEDPTAITGIPLIAVVRMLTDLGYTVP